VNPILDQKINETIESLRAENARLLFANRYNADIANQALASMDEAKRARDAVVILLRAKTDDATWAAYPDCIKDAVDAEYEALRQRAERAEADCARLRVALQQFVSWGALAGERPMRLEGRAAFAALYDYLVSVNHIHSDHGIVYASEIFELIAMAEAALAPPSAPAEPGDKS
jgi:hypothetical protein